MMHFNRTGIKKAVVCLLFLGCFIQSKTQKSVKSDSTVNGRDNSQNSVDWPGTYSGTLPCADCQGIETEIRLDKNLQFRKKTKYLGKSGETQELSGTFSWNTAGSQVILNVAGGNPAQEYYLVGENKLIMLDIQGNRIAGNMADRYILGKLNTAILEKYWKLTELRGRPVNSIAGTGREAHIIFKGKDNRVIGNGGCNSFSGSYTLGSNDRISLSKMISTLMACPQMDTESGFLKVLQMADNYFVSGDTLILNKARMTPLARFQAIYFK
jgi:copper homeostasis protein (lipoprotein)